MKTLAIALLVLVTGWSAGLLIRARQRRKPDTAWKATGYTQSSTGFDERLQKDGAERARLRYKLRRKVEAGRAEPPKAADVVDMSARRLK